MNKMRTPVDTQEWLYRRSYSDPERKYMNPDGSANSRVFKLREKDKGELSVDVKSMTTPEKSVGDPTRYMLFEIANCEVIDAGLRTEHDPLTIELDAIDNQAHAVILGMTEDNDEVPGLLARRARRVPV